MATFNYNNEKFCKAEFTLVNPTTNATTKVSGLFSDVRIDVASIPEGKEWYQIRHNDFDWDDPVSLKRGGIMVNFYGTFISEPIEGMNTGDEWDIESYEIDYTEDGEVPEYVIVTWPRSQAVMGKEGWTEMAILISTERGLEDYGPNAYIVDRDWFERVERGEIEDGDEDEDELYIADDTDLYGPDGEPLYSVL